MGGFICVDGDIFLIFLVMYISEFEVVFIFKLERGIMDEVRVLKGGYGDIEVGVIS